MVIQFIRIYPLQFLWKMREKEICTYFEPFLGSDGERSFPPPPSNRVVKRSKDSANTMSKLLKLYAFILARETARGRSLDCSEHGR